MDIPVPIYIASIAIACLILITAGCLDGSYGALGEGRFIYYCGGSGGPYCDCEDYADFCDQWSDSPWSDISRDNEMPVAVALGSRFRVVFEPGWDETGELQIAAPEMLRLDGDAG